MKVVDHAVGGRVPTTSTRQPRTVFASTGASNLVNGVYKFGGKCSPVWLNSVGTDDFFQRDGAPSADVPQFSTIPLQVIVPDWVNYDVIIAHALIRADAPIPFSRK
jgi:hypothetical protein